MTKQGGVWPGFTDFEDIFYYIRHFQANNRSPGAVKISTDSWDLPLQDFIHHVSRSGIIGYYTVMPSYPMGHNNLVGHIVKSDKGQI